MKKLILILLFAPLTSFADVEFTSELCEPMAPYSGLYHPANFTPVLTCETTGALSNGAQVIALTLTGASIYSACAGPAGLPAVLWLNVGSLGFRVADLMIKNLPCDNSWQEAQIKRLADEAVCQKMHKLGVVCTL